MKASELRTGQLLRTTAVFTGKRGKILLAPGAEVQVSVQSTWVDLWILKQPKVPGKRLSFKEDDVICVNMDTDLQGFTITTDAL